LNSAYSKPSLLTVFENVAINATRMVCSSRPGRVVAGSYWVFLHFVLVIVFLQQTATECSTLGTEWNQKTSRPFARFSHVSFSWSGIEQGWEVERRNRTDGEGGGAIVVGDTMSVGAEVTSLNVEVYAQKVYLKLIGIIWFIWSWGKVSLIAICIVDVPLK
jgi:hypothetical protein